MAEFAFNCATCPAYVAVNAKTGNCRRNPPHPFLVPGPPDPLNLGAPRLMIQAVWAPVGANDWCGCHPMFGATVAIDRRLAADGEGRA